MNSVGAEEKERIKELKFNVKNIYFIRVKIEGSTLCWLKQRLNRKVYLSDC